MKTYSNSHTHTRIPEPSAWLSIPAWSAVRWWSAGLFHRGSPAATERQHRPAPCCFALRDANTGRSQCLRSRGSAWQRALTGGLPRKKPLRESPGPQWNTCLAQRDCRLQWAASSASSASENPQLSVPQNENRNPCFTHWAWCEYVAEGVYLFKIQRNVLSPARGLKDDLEQM